MSVITIFSGVFSNTEPVVSTLIERTGYRPVSDDAVVAKASALSGMDKKKIKNAFSCVTSVFNQFTLEKERSIAYLKLAVSGMLDEEDIIFKGYTGLLIPPDIHHVLRVCLIANKDMRLALAQKESQLSEEDAHKIIAVQDHDRATWTDLLFAAKDPWAPSLYDIVLPMDKTFPQEAADLIHRHLYHEAIQKNRHTHAAIENFSLAAKVETALLDAGHHAHVEAADGSIVLTINQKVLMLSRLEEDLVAIVERIPGVKKVETRLADHLEDSRQIYRRQDPTLPSKVLLVDDEREFVQTLSDRLQMREMGSAVAFDGQTALDMVSTDDPEVMIIDLKMPGIDGIEVLKRVKQAQPEIEVIVLTGHGSEQDKTTCMELGAFAYLQKPVDIDVLSRTLKAAHDRAGKNRLAAS
jgi:two-component system response regulator CpxR